MAEGVPIDHPDLEPIWAAANDAGLCVAHHSFTSGYPGYRDLWNIEGIIEVRKLQQLPIPRLT